MRIKNWEKFQHYKQRSPIWIKLYRELLDDEEFFKLSGDEAKLLIMCWLVASEDKEMIGQLPSIKKLAFRLRVDLKHVEKNIKGLSHWIEGIGDDASNLLADIPKKPTLNIPKEKNNYTEAATKYLNIFNAAFERSCRASSLIAPAIEKRLKDKNIKLWQVYCLPLLVRARDFGDRKGLDPHVLLRDGRSPRTGHDGKTHGGYDWLTETFMTADKIILNERLTFIARNFGLTDDLEKTGCKMFERLEECTE